MAGARYDEDIMAEFSKIERMIAEQVGGSFNHDILQLKCFHILKIFSPNLLTINPDPADECQSFPLRKLSGLFTDNVQAYDTIHRFENLQRQNNSIIHRLSRVEERLAGTQHAGDLLNNRRQPAQHKSGEACQLEL